MAKTSTRRLKRFRRKKHIRKVVTGTAARPRMSIFRSSKHIYAQLIDDVNHATMASASSLKLDESGGNRDGASAVGKAIAAAAAEKNISEVVFDRNGYLYHGRVAALAAAAREAGLKF